MLISLDVIIALVAGIVIGALLRSLSGFYEGYKLGKSEED